MLSPNTAPCVSRRLEIATRHFVIVALDWPAIEGDTDFSRLVLGRAAVSGMIVTMEALPALQLSARLFEVISTLSAAATTHYFSTAQTMDYHAPLRSDCL